MFAVEVDSIEGGRQPKNPHAFCLCLALNSKRPWGKSSTLSTPWPRPIRQFSYRDKAANVTFFLSQFTRDPFFSRCSSPLTFTSLPFFSHFYPILFCYSKKWQLYYWTKKYFVISLRFLSCSKFSYNIFHPLCNSAFIILKTFLNYIFSMMLSKSSSTMLKHCDVKSLRAAALKPVHFSLKVPRWPENLDGIVCLEKSFSTNIHCSRLSRKFLPDWQGVNWTLQRLFCWYEVIGK